MPLALVCFEDNNANANANANAGPVRQALGASPVIQTSHDPRGHQARAR